MSARLPIRWRLSLWYAALLSCSIVLLGVGFYLGTRALLFDFFQEQLEKQAVLAMSSVHADGPSLSIDPNTVGNLRDDEHFVRLIGLDGSILVDTSASVGGVAIAEDVVAEAKAGSRQVTSSHTPEGTMLVATSPVHSGPDVIGVLQVGASRGDLEDVLRALLIGLLIAAPITLAIAAGGGYILAGRALAPVAAITALAASIGPTELERRLSLALPNDELGQLSRTFDAMLARIEDAFERQRHFTGDAAHELRTPLAFLRSQVDHALQRPRSPAEYQQALREINEDLERLTSLVSALLTLARWDSGRLPVEPVTFDLAETIGVLIEQYLPIAHEAGITVVNDAEPAPAFADQDLVIQLLVNLIGNALAHTPGGGTITIGSRLEGRRARLWVEDSGTGIAPEHRERIFDRFYRVDTGRDRAQGGIGLGLSICQAIAEAHGGTISVSESNAGGARLDVLLPILEPHNRSSVRPSS